MYKSLMVVYEMHSTTIEGKDMIGQRTNFGLNRLELGKVSNYLKWNIQKFVVVTKSALLLVSSSIFRLSYGFV
jgi:hypothetical protein